MIKESTYVLNNLAPYIELIFTSEVHLLMDSGVYPSFIRIATMKLSLQNSVSTYFMFCLTDDYRVGRALL